MEPFILNENGIKLEQIEVDISKLTYDKEELYFEMETSDGKLDILNEPMRICMKFIKTQFKYMHTLNYMKIMQLSSRNAC